MIKVELIMNLSEDLKKNNGFNSNQLISAAILGSSVGNFRPYEPNHVYMKGDKVPYITEEGELLIIVAIEDNISGSFNPNFWEEWNVISECDGLYNDYVVLSWNKPHLRRNKIWLEIKNESLHDARDVLGDDIGVLVYNNLVISERKPTMTADTIWGMVTEIL